MDEELRMKPSFLLTLVFAGCFLMRQISAQSPADGQNKQPTAGQNPAGSQQKPIPQSGANPFPEDTSTVPVMPSSGTVALPEGTDHGDDNMRLPFVADESDPVRSPDDPAAPGNEGQGSSSSLAGMDDLKPPPDDNQPGKKRKLSVDEPTHQESVKEDVNVGGYYLDKKNWRAALSRFESAMILDPENPDVYWGLAEAERHLGALADARSHYQKVVDYDPDSKHGKDARKALKDPEIANAVPPAAGQSLAGGSQK
jgi:Tetratricopeptide repeat